LANSTVYWWAPVGSSGCANIGYFGNGFSYLSDPLSRNNGVAMAAWGTVQTNGSGVVSGTVTVIGNATGCTSPPTITVYSDQALARQYLAVMGQEILVIHLTSGAASISGCPSA